MSLLGRPRAALATTFRHPPQAILQHLPATGIAGTFAQCRAARQVGRTGPRCKCGARTAIEQFSAVIWVKSGECCGNWGIFTRLPLRHRWEAALVAIVEQFAHPDDIVFTPWLPF